MSTMEPALQALHGQSLATVFRIVVLEHPSVAAAAREVVEQTKRHASVFEQAQAPGPLVNYNWDLNITAEALASEFTGSIVHFWETPSPKPSIVIVHAATALATRIQRLREFLTERQLIGKGTYSQTGVTAEIGHLEWARQGTLIDVRNSDLLEVINHKLTTRWTGIWLEVVDAKATRGTVTDKAAMRVESSAAAIRECTRWLADAMNASPAERKGTKQSWWKKAKIKWPRTLSRRGFDKAWADAVSQTKASAWAAAGAPRKSNNNQRAD
jgi:hypothetical protein